MNDVMATQEQTLAAAQEIFEQGVVKAGLDPSDPHNQVLVAGAVVVLAAADAGLSPGDVLSLIQFAGEAQRAREQGREQDEVRGYL